jgi:hypothetical protein
MLSLGILKLFSEILDLTESGVRLFFKVYGGGKGAKENGYGLDEMNRSEWGIGGKHVKRPDQENSGHHDELSQSERSRDEGIEMHLGLSR